MSIANNNSVLGFLDLSLYINEHNNICIDVYDKPTNSFKYVLPSHFTYVWLASQKRVLTKFLKELQRISDSDEKFDIRSFEIWIPKLFDRGRSQSYSSKTKNSFPLLEIWAEVMLNKLSLSHRLNKKLVTAYNPIIKKLQTVISNNLHILYGDPGKKNVFPEGSINIT